MEPKRLIELLAYAKVCFDNCTSPFETTHLVKKDVRSYECRDLSREIADIIEKELYTLSTGHYDIKAILQQAEKDFAETQT
jgi:hypothetical protein